MYEYLKGKTISFEGGEGCGKSLLIRNLLDFYNRNSNLDILSTREPGGNDISEKIRNVVLDKKNTNISSETEALLFAASRAQLMKDIIFPAIESNKTIILDRFVDSSLVYQGYVKELGIEKVYQLNLFATKNWIPDLTIILDIEPKVALKRISDNKRETNRWDLVSLEYHEKIREGYLKLANLYPNRIKVINANQSPKEVVIDTLGIIENKFN